jgi:serine/threonine-protein kinase RsbT
LNGGFGTVAAEVLTIASGSDVVRVRQAARAYGVRAALSLVDQTKLVTAASELARNALVHGGGGVARLEIVSDGRRQGVRATFVDQGPGIAEIGLALTDGWASGGGLGLGLSGSRRLMDAFEIAGEPGLGTTVAVTKWGR